MEQKPVRDLAPLRGYPRDYGMLLAALKDGTRDWRDGLGRVKEEAIVWQPFEGGHSIGGVILHIIDAEAYWVEEAVLGRTREPSELQELLSEETRQYEGIWPVPPSKPLRYYYDLQDKVRKRTLASVREFDDPLRAVTSEGWKRAYTLRWVLNHIVAHESYHGGQAVLLKAIYSNR